MGVQNIHRTYPSDISNVIMSERKHQPGNGDSPLRDLRERLGLTQQEMANILGASIVAVSRWERGVRPLLMSSQQMLAMLDLVHQADWTMEDFLHRQIAYEQMAKSA